MMTDIIGDMLTRIRNAHRAGKDTVECPHSVLRKAILDTLQREGYIRGSSVRNVRKGISMIDIDLHYHEGKPVINVIKRVSKPGRRVYSSIKELSMPFNGLGIYVLSTQNGILSDIEARTQNVGGEVLCSVF